MQASQQPRRATCATCLRAQRTCICQWITPIQAQVEVVILQHPLELDNAKGSARLLHLSLPGSTLVTGETFAEPELRALLGGPAGSTLAPRMPVLLYPETPGDRSLGIAAPPVLERAGAPPALRLIVLDGTWRKSRKMLYLNRLLHSLPRLPLTQMPASHYRIRKAHAPDQLSTLEATCYALMQLEGDPLKFQPLLDAFDGFVAQQAAYVPNACAP